MLQELYVNAIAIYSLLKHLEFLIRNNMFGKCLMEHDAFYKLTLHYDDIKWMHKMYLNVTISQEEIWCYSFIAFCQYIWKRFYLLG